MSRPRAVAQCALAKVDYAQFSGGAKLHSGSRRRNKSASIAEINEAPQCTLIRGVRLPSVWLSLRVCGRNSLVAATAERELYTTTCVLDRR